MKIGIATCMWQRPEVFDIYAEGINRLRKKFDIMPLAVGSEGKVSEDLCRKHKFMYIEHYNRPLGKKFAEGLRCFKNTDVDYVMIMGSDDLISDNLMEAYMPHMENREQVIGILDIYYYDLSEGDLCYWPGFGLKDIDKKREGEPMGMARCLSRELLDKMGWNVWNEKINKGLDWTMWQKIKGYDAKIATIKMKDIGAFGVDLKSETNICNMEMYDCEVVSKDIMNILSETELKLIRAYNK